ncbi:hypothetical protein BGX34_004055 [Mortierella sp. NVP85]|nr:hypothetical protein BGX34_004055 [Mortierella sp. NVP85]
MNSQDAPIDDIHKKLLGRNAPLGKGANPARRILLTGGAGFIGSVLAKKLVFNYPEYFVLVIDKLDYCSSLNNLHPLLSLDEWPIPLLATTTVTETTSTATATPTTTATTTTTKAYPNFKFIHGDITDLHTVETAMIEHKIDTVLHLAAQTHVDKSFGESIDFTKNNVLGTHVMLEAARKVFCPHPFVKSTYAPGSGNGQIGEIERDPQTKEGEPMKRFLFVSTDEVYGEVLLDKPDCKEDAQLSPSNPYSATKAAAESMVQVYYKSFHLPIIITRSNNIYGPFQYPEKIFPKFIMNLLNSNNLSNSDNISILSTSTSTNTPIPADNDSHLRIENHVVYQRNILKPGTSRRKINTSGHCFIHGSGQHSRTYLYVTDVADALDVILHRGEVGQVYNIGGGYEMSNLELAQDVIHRMVPTSPTHQPGNTDIVNPNVIKRENGIGPQTQQNGHGHGCEHQLDQDLLQRPLGNSNGHYKDKFSEARQEAAEQHLSRCKTCADRIVFVEDRVFNDRRYAVDTTRLNNLGWSPSVSIEEGIPNTSKGTIIR